MAKRERELRAAVTVAEEEWREKMRRKVRYVVFGGLWCGGSAAGCALRLGVHGVPTKRLAIESRWVANRWPSLVNRDHGVPVGARGAASQAPRAGAPRDGGEQG
eukprot:COSAG06_NODE_22409_length_724_cov_1.273600_2_plen_104_part_00